MDNHESVTAPLHKEITVPLTVQKAFRLFTERIDEWWPLASHSIFEKDTRKAVFEGKQGGRIFEISNNGEEGLWGTISAYEPPDRVIFTWHPGRDTKTAQEVEVTFQADASGTKVRLEHRDWEKLGDKAAASRAGYDTGWDFVLGKCFGSGAGVNAR